MLMLLMGMNAFSASVSLLWDPSPDSNAVGYAVYYGTVGTPTPNRIDVGNVTNAPVNSLQPGLTYFFYVTAYDSARNESDPSNVINYTVPSSSSSNNTPWLGTISNQVVRANTLCTFTAWATDVDVPVQILTFSLDPPGLPSATIHPATGLFRWTPTNVGIYSVIVRVTDNGMPALSRIQTVQITVLSGLLSPINMKIKNVL
jgi:hypothetical protein